MLATVLRSKGLLCRQGLVISAWMEHTSAAAGKLVNPPSNSTNCSFRLHFLLFGAHQWSHVVPWLVGSVLRWA